MDPKDLFDKVCGAVKNLPIANKYTLEKIEDDPDSFIRDVDEIADKPLDSIKEAVKGFSLNTIIDAGKEFFNVK